MENLDAIVSDALTRYFDSLAETGYLNQSNVDALILLIGIKDIFKHFNEYITRQDISTIVNVLNCLNNSCLISLPVKYTNDSLFDILKEEFTLKDE